MSKPVKAVGLLSGGLDSTIAAAMLMRQGIEIQGLTFYTGFCVVEHNRRSKTRKRKKPVRNEALQAGAKLDLPVEMIDISGPDYLKVLTDPKYGYGKTVNPCIDCRIFMFRRARQYMDEIGAQFMFTGEVLGQRPMSQRRQPMNVIDRDAELDGLLLRPLSAKRLPPTVPEQEGWVDREQLGDIQGRSRQKQMELAEEYGIEDYPSPAGGCCYLTDAEFRPAHPRFLRARGQGKPDHGRRDAPQDRPPLPRQARRQGRHGREEGENKFLERYTPGRWRLETKDVTGPTTLVEGDPTEDDLRQIAGMTVRYAGSKADPDTPVACRYEDTERVLEPSPVEEAVLEAWRV